MHVVMSVVVGQSGDVFGGEVVCGYLLYVNESVGGVGKEWYVWRDPLETNRDQ